MIVYVGFDVEVVAAEPMLVVILVSGSKKGVLCGCFASLQLSRSV